MINCILKNKMSAIKIGVVLLIAIAGMYIRFKEFGSRELTIDEPQQCYIMGQSFTGMIKRIKGFQSPGDYILVWPFYRLFGGTRDNAFEPPPSVKWGAAIPHIVTTILGFYLLYIMCNKYFKTVYGYIITFLIYAFNHNLIFYSLAIRPYSVMVTLGIMAFFITGYVVKQEIQPLSKRILISMFIFVTLLFHAFGIFILFFPYLFHLLSLPDKKTIRVIFLKTLKYYGPVLIITLPIVYYFTIGFITKASSYGTDTFEYIHRGIIPIAKGVFGNLTGLRILYLLLPGIIINFFIPHREKLDQIMFFLILIMAQIGVILWVTVVFKFYFVPRAFIWMIPLFAFMMGWIWDSIIVYLLGYFGKKQSVQV